MLIDISLYNWLLLLKAIDSQPMQSAGKVLVDESTFLSGVAVSRLLLALFPKKQVQSQLRQLKKKQTSGSKLYNWNILANLFKRLKFQLDPIIKNNIVAGDVNQLIQFLKDFRQFVDKQQPGVMNQYVPLSVQLGNIIERQLKLNKKQLLEVSLSKDSFFDASLKIEEHLLVNYIVSLTQHRQILIQKSNNEKNWEFLLLRIVPGLNHFSPQVNQLTLSFLLFAKTDLSKHKETLSQLGTIRRVIRGIESNFSLVQQLLQIAQIGSQSLLDQIVRSFNNKRQVLAVCDLVTPFLKIDQLSLLTLSALVLEALGVHQDPPLFRLMAFVYKHDLQRQAILSSILQSIQSQSVTTAVQSISVLFQMLQIQANQKGEKAGKILNALLKLMSQCTSQQVYEFLLANLASSLVRLQRFPAQKVILASVKAHWRWNSSHQLQSRLMSTCLQTDMHNSWLLLEQSLKIINQLVMNGPINQLFFSPQFFKILQTIPEGKCESLLQMYRELVRTVALIPKGKQNLVARLIPYLQRFIHKLFASKQAKTILKTSIKTSFKNQLEKMARMFHCQQEVLQTIPCVSLQHQEASSQYKPLQKDFVIQPQQSEKISTKLTKRKHPNNRAIKYLQQLSQLRQKKLLEAQQQRNLRQRKEVLLNRSLNLKIKQAFVQHTPSYLKDQQISVVASLQSFKSEHRFSLYTNQSIEDRFITTLIAFIKNNQKLLFLYFRLMSQENKTFQKFTDLQFMTLNQLILLAEPLLLSKKQVLSIVKFINKEDRFVLSYEGLKEYIFQLGLISLQQVNMSLQTLLSPVFKVVPKKINSETAQEKQLTQKILENSQFQLPKGFRLKKIYAVNYLNQFTKQSKFNLPEAYSVCYEILDQVLRERVGSNIVQTVCMQNVSRVVRKVKYKSTNVSRQKKRASGPMRNLMHNVSQAGEAQIQKSIGRQMLLKKQKQERKKNEEQVLVAQQRRKERVKQLKSLLESHSQRKKKEQQQRLQEEKKSVKQRMDKKKRQRLQQLKKRAEIREKISLYLEAKRDKESQIKVDHPNQSKRSVQIKSNYVQSQIKKHKSKMTRSFLSQQKPEFKKVHEHMSQIVIHRAKLKKNQQHSLKQKLKEQLQDNAYSSILKQHSQSLEELFTQYQKSNLNRFTPPQHIQFLAFQKLMANSSIIPQKIRPKTAEWIFKLVQVERSTSKGISINQFLLILLRFANILQPVNNLAVFESHLLIRPSQVLEVPC